MNIPAKTKPAGVKGQYGSYVKFFLFDVNDYELESFTIYELWVYESKKDCRHLFSSRDKSAVTETARELRGQSFPAWAAIQIREEKVYPVKI